MNRSDLINIAKLRLSVGYLGEAHQSAWWTSSFLCETSTAFLSPVFSKTTLLARYYGVRDAAARVHDEHIGIGEGVFHLFRLPEALERELHELVGDSDVAETLSAVIQNKEAAQETLDQLSADSRSDGVGPVRLGQTTKLQDISTWQIAAQSYRQGFQSNSKVYPYLSETK